MAYTPPTREAAQAIINRLFGPVFRLGDMFGETEGRERPHSGIDLIAPRGTPVYALLPGTVRYARAAGSLEDGINDCKRWFVCGGGNTLVIDIVGKPDRHIQYAHLDKFASGIKEGTHINTGDLIGYVGNTGHSSGDHLHLAVRWAGEFVDPFRLFFDMGLGLVGENFTDNIGDFLGSLGDPSQGTGIFFLLRAENWLRIGALFVAVGLLYLTAKSYATTT